jgi:hypothetical protein
MIGTFFSLLEIIYDYSVYKNSLKNNFVEEADSAGQPQYLPG